MELEQFGYVEENASLKNKNTYHIDSYTKYLLHPNTIEEVKGFLQYAKKKKIEYFILGNGSNIILSDGTYPGVIVKLDRLQNVLYQGQRVKASAGVMLNKLSYDIIEHGLKGLEWASGIPGTVGGSVFGNAGAYNEEIFNFIESVTYIDSNGNIETKKKEEIPHGYRTTWFKEQKEYIILEVIFQFSKGNKEESLEMIKNRLERRMSTQPLEYPSAGSVFRNPSSENPSWRLIDEVGLKGYRIGDAMVSDRHANFIVNMGHASGQEIKNLIKLIQEKVKKEKNIDLILEQEYKSW